MQGTLLSAITGNSLAFKMDLFSGVEAQSQLVLDAGQTPQAQVVHLDRQDGQLGDFRPVELH